MANKTKAELTDEVKAKNDEIKELKAEIEKLDRYKKYEEMANEIAAVRDSFVNAGFSKTEAFTMTKFTMQMATNPLLKLM